MKNRVMFRLLEGELIALLLDEPANRGMVLCYQHIGQHGEGTVDLVNRTKPAKLYQALLAELTSIGYDLRVVKRWNRRVT